MKISFDIRLRQITIMMIIGMLLLSSGVLGIGRIKEPSGSTAGYWSGGVQYIMNESGYTWTPTTYNLWSAINNSAQPLHSGLIDEMRIKPFLVVYSTLQNHVSSACSKLPGRAQHYLR